MMYKKGTKKYYKACAKMSLDRLELIIDKLDGVNGWIDDYIDAKDCLLDIINDEDSMLEEICDIKKVK